MKYLVMLIAAISLSACAAMPNNPTIHSSVAVAGFYIDAADNTGSPAIAGGLYGATMQITPNESREGVVMQSEWDEWSEDGTQIVRIRDQRSTCSVNSSNIMAELGFGDGNVVHITGTGNGTPELCGSVGDWVGPTVAPPPE